MPLSRDPEKRARQLANLRPAPAAPAGHSRSLVHGGRAEVLFRDVSDAIRGLLDVLGELAPVRDPDGSLPAADAVAVERAARALKRYRHLAGWLDLHGRLTDAGDVKPASEYELRAERELAAALAELGMTPASRAKLGLDLQRAATSAEEADAARAPEVRSFPLISDSLARRQDFEQVANLPLLDEGMPQGKIMLDLVAVPPALSLAQHVALVD